MQLHQSYNKDAHSTAFSEPHNALINILSMEQLFGVQSENYTIDSDTIKCLKAPC